MYSAKIIADSVNPVGDRLTTFELTYPRFVHAELMTHRLFSRNSASSRAIPTKKLLEQIENNPVMPKFWGKNQKGMQAAKELLGVDLIDAQTEWLIARDKAVESAKAMHIIGVHKQLANRVLEPWMFITVIVTATEYENWYYLRDSEFAQPEIAWVAREMRKKHEESLPQPIEEGRWHLPYVELDDVNSPLFVNAHEVMEVADGTPLEEMLVKISTARCARVSYLTHDGQRDFRKDIELHDKCRDNGHWSAFEHPAFAMRDSRMSGNFKGWTQYRKTFKNEHAGRRLA